MSAPSGPDRCEPNLTPLLDLVLQLVMFFMLISNFIADQLNQKVVLPKSSTAIGLTKGMDRLIFINIPLPEFKTVNGQTSKQREVQKYEVSLGSQTTEFNNKTELMSEMKRRFEVDRTRAEKRKLDFDGKGEGRSIVIIRADERLDFKVVREAQEAIRDAGYTTVHNRAKKPGS